MADDHKNEVQETGNRIIAWLLEHRSEFEQNGVEESSLSAELGLSEDQARETIDYLESREDVARFPEAIGDTPRFLLKPARGWHEIASKATA